MKNQRWQNLAFGLAFTLPVIGAYIAKRLIAKYKNRSPGTQPEVTRIRVPITSLIGINDGEVLPQPKQESIVLPAVTEITLELDELPQVADSVQGQFVASSEGDKFHRPECRWAQNIKPENSIFLENKVIAIERGYSPCNSCNP